MKKVYLLATSLMLGAVSFAQTWDMETSFVTPASGATVAVATDDTYGISCAFKNNGPDAVPVGDTVFMGTINVTQQKVFATDGTENSANMLTIPSALSNGWTPGMTITNTQIGLSTIKIPGGAVGDVILFGIYGVGEASLADEDAHDSNNDNNFDGFVLGSTGLEKLDMSSFSVYPNPATEMITVTATEPIASVKVLSLNGAVVASAEGATVNVAELKAGAYIYHATTVSGKNVANKFVKK